MQVSIVHYKDLNHEMRIDAEYYKADILSRINVLNKKNNVTLDKLVNFIVGPFGSTVTVDKYVPESNYRYVRNKDIGDFVIKDNDPALIPEDIYSSLQQFHIKEKDILITVVGTLGKVAIARKSDSKCIFSCKSTMLRARKVNPYYLITYLNSPTGQLFLLRGKRGAIQEGLNLSDLKEVKVFIPSEDFQDFIEYVIMNSFSLTEKSNHLYLKSQDILLSELGLLDWKPSNQLSFVRNYTETERAERLDAEYFQPKYDEIIRVIKQYKGGYNYAEKILIIKDKNFNPKLDNEYNYIELADIGREGEITGYTRATGQELPTRARRKVATDDVIISSIEGSLPSIALITNEFNNALCSTGFYVVRSSIINSESLLVLMKSIVCQLLLKKGCSGTILTAINKDEFKKIVLPIISSEIQEQIKQKVIESFNLRKQAKFLLECTKKAVEMAIEKDEDTATQWLESQISTS